MSHPLDTPKKKFLTPKKIALAGILLALLVAAGCSALVVGTVASHNDAPSASATSQAVQPSQSPSETSDVPREHAAALSKAEMYSGHMNMSKGAIYGQLTSGIDGFDKDAAQYAVDNIQADWNLNALAKAKDYATVMSMSDAAIHNQLTSSVDKFTKEQADYAIANLN